MNSPKTWTKQLESSIWDNWQPKLKGDEPKYDDDDDEDDDDNSDDGF